MTCLGFHACSCNIDIFLFWPPNSCYPMGMVVGWKEKVLTSESRAGDSARRCQSMWHPKGWSNSEKTLARGSMVSGNSEPLASRKSWVELLTLAPCYS